MGVGLLLKGVGAAESDADFATRTKTWFTNALLNDPWGRIPRTSESTDGDDAFEIEVVPFDEPVGFTVLGTEDGSVTFQVSAKTSGGGPGYHIALCELLKEYADELDVEWLPLGDDEEGSNDETGYFFTGDASAVEAAMRIQVQAMARQSLELLGEGMTAIRWNAPLNAPTYLCPGAVLTQLGPRDEAWLAEVARDATRGDDIFPWWSADDDARLALGTVLHAMWNDIPWREAEDEDDYAGDVLYLLSDRLETAMEAGLDCPWREWVELEGSLDLGSEKSGELLADVTARARAVPSDVPLVGYRRYPARHVVANGWSVVVPGSFVHEWVDEDRWAAWDSSRGTVWVSPLSLAKQDGSPVPAEELVTKLPADAPPDPTLARREDRLVGRGAFLDVDPEATEGSRLNLQAFAATDGHLAVFNVYLTDPDDRAWAIETWRSLCRDGE